LTDFNLDQPNQYWCHACLRHFTVEVGSPAHHFENAVVCHPCYTEEKSIRRGEVERDEGRSR